MLAATLLVAITVVVGTLTAGFVSTTFQGAQVTIANKSAEGVECSNAAVTIDGVYARVGDNGTVTLPVRNSGFSDNLQIVSAQLYDKLGNNFSALNVPVSGFDSGEITSLVFQMPKLPDTAQDSSSYGNNATIGDPSSADSAQPAWTLDGKYGSALRFDGSNDFVNTTFRDIGAYSAFTVEAWANPLSLNAAGGGGEFAGTPVVVGPLASIGGTEFVMGWLNATTVQTFYRFASGWYIVNGNITSSPVNAWHHLAFTYNASTDPKAIMYYDGILVGTNNGTKSLGISELYWEIARGYSNPFSGSIDEIALWNRTLSGDEINVTRVSATDINTAGLIAYWKFAAGRGVLICSDFSQVVVTTNCGGISTTFDKSPVCS